MARVTGKYYWVIKGKPTKNFNSEKEAKRYFLSKYKNDTEAFGRNQLYLTKSPIWDEAVGYYGISKNWNEGLI